MWRWVLFAPLRLLFHAVAAICGTIFVSHIGLYWTKIVKELVGGWLVIEGNIFSKSGKVIQKRRRNRNARHGRRK